MKKMAWRHGSLVDLRLHERRRTAAHIEGRGTDHPKVEAETFVLKSTLREAGMPHRCRYRGPPISVQAVEIIDSRYEEFRFDSPASSPTIRRRSDSSSAA